MGNRPPRTLISLAACIAASILLCLPILNANLVSDDWVLLDAVVHKGVWAAWGGGGHEMLGFFRPLITLTLWFNYQIGGLNPLGYHLFNAVVHGICAWLVGVVAFLFLRNAAPRHQGSGLIPALASLIFLVHPSHAEPVAWVSARGDLMACAFGLAAFALWIHSPKISNSILAGMCLIAALLAKESAIVVPVFLFAFELIVAGRGTHGKRVGHALRRTWPLFLILIIFMVIRAMALGHAVGGYGSERILGIHPLFWARNLAAATFRSFMPIIPHSFDWPDWIPFFLIAISLPICVIYLILRHLRQSDASPQSLVPRLIVFCSLAFVVSVVPVLNLPLSIRNSEGERFIYLPTVFTSIMLAVFLASTFQRKYSFILTGILLYFMALELSFATWGMAGRLSGNLVGDLRTIVDSRTVERLDVYNLPDHLRGAYVFRNGFVKAARLNGITPERIKEIKIQNVQPIQNVNEKFENPTLTASPGTISINYSEGKLKEISR